MSALLAVPQRTISIDDAIERLGYGRFQIKVLLATGLCFVTDAIQILIMSFLDVILQKLWNLSNGQTAILTSVAFLGQFLGTATLGPLGDKFGRRPVFILAAFITALFGLATAFCTNFAGILLVRLLVGFGVGGQVVPFDIYAELIPVEHRGQDLVFTEYFWTFGTVLLPLAAFLTIGIDAPFPHDHENRWRFFVAACALPSFLSATIGSCLVPESPRWLLSTGRGDKAMDILRCCASTNRMDAFTVFPEGLELEPETHESSSIFDLFSPVWRWITVSLWMTWAGLAFLYFGNIFFTTLIFTDSLGLSHGNEVYEFDYASMFITALSETFGTTVAIFAIDRIGRIQLLAISSLLSGSCIMLLAILTTSAPGSPHAALVTLAFVARMFTVSGTITAWVATAEILTTEIRSTGHSAANAWSRLGAFCAPYLVQESTSPLLAGCIMLGISLLTAFAVAWLPETKGKSLGKHSPEYSVILELSNQVSESAMVES